MNFSEFELNNNFHLEECGICSGWTYNVFCPSSEKYAIIQISKCKDEDLYTVTPTSLDIDCDISTKTYPNTREALLTYLFSNFRRVDNEDQCAAFHGESNYIQVVILNKISNENESTQ